MLAPRTGAGMARGKAAVQRERLRCQPQHDPTGAGMARGKAAFPRERLRCQPQHDPTRTGVARGKAAFHNRATRTRSAACAIVACFAVGGAGMLAAQTGDDVARGKAVFDNYCIHCHGTGPHNSGATAILQEKYAGAVPGSLEERTTLTPEFIREFVRGDIGMAAYRPTEIPDSDLEALTGYLMRNNPPGSL